MPLTWKGTTSLHCNQISLESLLKFQWTIPNWPECMTKDSTRPTKSRVKPMRLWISPITNDLTSMLVYIQLCCTQDVNAVIDAVIDLAFKVVLLFDCFHMICPTVNIVYLKLKRPIFHTVSCCGWTDRILWMRFVLSMIWITDRISIFFQNT